MLGEPSGEIKKRSKDTEMFGTKFGIQMLQVDLDMDGINLL